MLFTLEAIKGKFGDAILLHYGTLEEPRLVLIDGGPPGVFRASLKPRLKEIQSLLDLQGPVPVSLAMVSHIDSDHIAGLIDLTKEEIRARDRGKPRLVEISAFWNNSFDDLLGNRELSRIATLPNTASFAASAGVDPHSLLIAAGVKQGQKLRDQLKSLRLGGNPPFGKFVVATTKSKSTIKLGPLKLTVIGPHQKELEGLQKEWDKELRSQQGASNAVRRSRAAAFLDRSAANLSSIVVMAESKRKRMLFTGDARGDHILKGLRRFRYFRSGKVRLDVLKVPHHGSHHNVTEEFFRQLPAKHYVFSGDGHHGNPEIDTLKMVTSARGRARYTFHFTYRLAKLERFFKKDSKDNRRNYKVRYREEGDFSIWVDLGQALDF